MDHSRRAERLVTVASVLAVTAVLTHSWFPHLATTSQADGGDPPLYLFWLGHLPWAVLHGHNPLLTGEVNAPQGLNGMWNTSILTVAAVLSPVTLLGGVVLAYDVAVIGGLALGALACVKACRRFVPSWPAALAGGLLAGFSPYVVTQAAGHPNLAILVAPPLLLVVGHHLLVVQERRDWVVGLALAAIVVLQAGTSTELLASSALLAGVGVVVLALLHRAELTRERVAYVVRGLGVAVGASLLVLAIPLYELFRGPQHLTGPAQSTKGLVADALSPIEPVRAELISTSDHLHGVVPYEATAYLGLPLLVVLVAVVVRGRAQPLVRWTAVMALVSLVMSFGDSLHVDGHDTGIPLPFALISHLPLLESSAAVRWSAYTALFCGLLLAIGLAQLEPRPLLAGAVAAVSLVPLLPSGFIAPYPGVPVRAPAWFTGSGVQRVPSGSLAAIYPYPSRFTTAPMAWIAMAHFRYRQLGAYGITPDPARGGRGRFDVPSPLSFVETRLAVGVSPPQGSAPAKAAVKLLHDQQVRTVVVVLGTPGADLAVAWFTAALGKAPVVGQGVAAFYDLG